MSEKIWHDGGGGVTDLSLRYFKRNAHKLGQIIQINIDQNRQFMMEIEAVNGIMLLSGCNCGYGGTGPHGSIEILKMLGLVPRDLRGSELYNHPIAREIFTQRHVELDLRKEGIFFKPYTDEEVRKLGECGRIH